MTSVPPGQGENIKGSQTDGRRRHTQKQADTKTNTNTDTKANTQTHTQTQACREERQTQIGKNEVEVHKKIDTRDRLNRDVDI